MSGIINTLNILLSGYKKRSGVCSGDLLVHSDDVKMLLAKDGEWIAYADKRSEDAVRCICL